SNNPKMFNKVDYPHPEGPIIAPNSPSLITNETPFNAVVSISSVLKTLLKSVTLIITINF
ncbi:MAG: hypothetical protein IKU18_00580, partial [Bacteroidales bacterium]|nr:hypothetical protein [Bacteroidales bacterium]